ncbi:MULTISPECIES: LemA family protein [Psychrobacter]|jgi:LemA protein|uniref:LemA family protein n=1 Tax=Psychrobacter communis TaxID=2762238 RepID=A0ABR8RJT5_9GAMM|nr:MULTISPECIES: LemA family protein [Psychrobacter]MBP8046893.1 LemA family protein [Psychrobacter sp.]MBD7947907.1 LemA family protein [Psychrobacter communis]MDN5694456.1 LemA family protein [Psychrobacter sp.]TSB24839.1 LemA family protein [Psychrobacter sp. YGAH215]WLW66853.1 LemA family protein [Psychrobacter sp. van23A]
MTRKSFLKPMLLSAVLATSTVGLSGCGYNNLQAQDEQVTAAWSEVVNQYQRRSDLVPNLVKVVQQYAKQEQEVFTQVAAARSQAGGITVTPELLNDPEAMERYAAAQDQMTGALSRLMAVSERYPELKSDALFQDLQAQLEGTENRITVARNRYIQEVQGYNTTVRQFPTNITAKVFGMDAKPNFSVANEKEISTAPSVNFGDDNAQTAQ